MNRYNIKFLIVSIIMAIGACGPLPQPFTKSSSGSRADLILHRLPPVVAVNAINGASIPMAKLLVRAVADELTKREVIAYSGDKGSSTHVLNGRVEPPPNRKSKSSPTYIEWALTKRTGELITTFRYMFKATPLDWDYGSPEIIHEIGQGTANILALELSGPVDAAEQAVAHKTGLWIRPVAGTPGDGDFSLTRAITYALADAGVGIVKKRSDAEFGLKAQVRIDSPKSNKQQVEINWIVIGDDDLEIGRATQKNIVPAGTFNVRWGQVAVMIAAAAAGSVRDILNRERNQSLDQGIQVLIPRFNQDQKDQNIALPPPSLTPE
jgi:hypothetical protein